MPGQSDPSHRIPHVFSAGTFTGTAYFKTPVRRCGSKKANKRTPTRHVAKQTGAHVHHSQCIQSRHSTAQSGVQARGGLTAFKQGDVYTCPYGIADKGSKGITNCSRTRRLHPRRDPIGNVCDHAVQNPQPTRPSHAVSALQSLALNPADRVCPSHGIQVETVYIICRVSADPAGQPGCVITVAKIVKAAGIALFARITDEFVAGFERVFGRPPSRPPIGVVAFLTQ